MKKLATLSLLIIFSFSSRAQTTYAESANISTLPSGLYYQTGPGSGNVSGGYNWTYPYGTKMSLNVGSSRSFELMAIDKDARGLVYRQWTEGLTWTPWRTVLTTNSGGNVGVGIAIPNAQMDIHSTSSHALRLSTNSHANDQKIEFHAVSGTYHSIVSNTNSGNLQIRAGDGGSGHEVLFFTDGSGRAGVSSNGGLAVGNSYYSLNTAANRLIVEGDLGIGTSSPNAKLDIRDGHLYVGDENFSNPGNWPDYVFSSTFELRTLSELEQYVQANKHLPEIPSASEIEEKGLDLGAMDAALLKKVEELTLYTIEQEKKITSQSESLKLQSKENEALRALIESLSDRIKKLEKK